MDNETFEKYHKELEKLSKTHTKTEAVKAANKTCNLDLRTGQVGFIYRKQPFVEPEFQTTAKQVNPSVTGKTITTSKDDQIHLPDEIAKHLNTNKKYRVSAGDNGVSIVEENTYKKQIAKRVAGIKKAAADKKAAKAAAK